MIELITSICTMNENNNVIFQKDGFFQERFDIMIITNDGEKQTRVRVNIDSMIEIRNFLNKTLEGL